MKLRPYQHDAVTSVIEAFSAASSALIVLPTGTGKTVCFLHVAERMKEAGRIMILAHREELIWQAAKRYEHIAGEAPDIEMAELRARHSLFDQSKVVVSSVQTQNAGRGDGRMATFDPNQFSLLIVDECHHAPARSWQKVISYYQQNPDLKVLGVTATPDRKDEQALGKIFETVAYDYELPDAIRDGWLVPIEQRAVHVKGLDYSSIRTTAGDLNGADLARVMEYEEALHGIASPTIEIASGRKTLLFAASLAHAERLCEIFNRHNEGCSRWVHGGTPKEERRQLIKDYAAGRFQILCNVGVACLDSETEILTDRGWIGHAEMTQRHRVACWDRGAISFAEPLAIEVRDRRPDERMIVLETKNRSIRVTEDHRMLYRTTRGGAFHVMTAGKMIGKKCGLPISGHAAPWIVTPEQEDQRVSKRRIQANAYALRKRHGMSKAESESEAMARASRRAGMRHLRPSELSEAQCEFVGFWLGDGTKTCLAKGGVEYLLWQAESYPRLVRWIDGLIERLGFDARRRVKKERRPGGARVIQWSLPRGTGFGPQRRRGLYAIEPYLRKQGSPLFWGLNSEQFSALLRGFWMADGEHGDAPVPSSGPWRISNTNRKLFDLLQAIACCRGFRANISDGASNTKAGHKPLWRLSVSQRAEHRMTKHTLRYEAGWRAETVWCVKSVTGFIVTRRRGTVTVTGNTEGFDEPGIEVVVMARPTKSRALYAQMAGRGTRPLTGMVDGLEDADERRLAIATSGKPLLEVVDFVGNAGRHKLVTSADILGGKYDDAVVARAKKKAEDEGEAGRQVDMLEALDDAQREIEEAAERARRKALRVRAHYSTSTINPFDVLQMRPWKERGWDKGRQPSEKMVGFLERNGIPAQNLSFAHARQLIQEIIGRREKKQATYKQARLLAKYGYETDMDFAEAKQTIDAIKAAGWRRPEEVSVAQTRAPEFDLADVPF